MLRITENISTEFEIRNYQPKDESLVLDLVQQGLGGGPTGKRDEIFWRWKHRDNPFGHSIGLVATNSLDRLVGLRIFLQWRFTVGSTTVKAVRAVDTVTHPEYRRYGVFSVLTKKAVEQARDKGVSLIFNTPNNTVLPGYLKLGWNYVSPIRPMVKILNYPRFIAGVIRNRNIHRSSGQFSNERLFRYKLPSTEELFNLSNNIEELLDRHNKNSDKNLSTEWSLDYLSWRYSKYPYADYTVVHQEKSGKILGFIILRPNNRFGLKEIIINELITHKPDEDLALSLMNEMKRCVKADYIIAYFRYGSFERHVLKRFGFRQIPKDSMNFAINLLDPKLPSNPLVLDNWGLSLGDLEIF